MTVIRRQVNTAWEMTDTAAIKGQVVLDQEELWQKDGIWDASKRAGRVQAQAAGDV